MKASVSKGLSAAAWVPRWWWYVELLGVHLEGILSVSDQKHLDAGFTIPLSSPACRCGARHALCGVFPQKILQGVHGVPPI